MLTTAGMLFYMINNGFSGLQSIPDLLYATVNVNMSLMALAFFVPFNQDVSFDKYGRGIQAESKMPFAMPEMFKSRMTQANKFVSDYVCIMLWGFLGGGFMYLCWAMFERNGGILGIDAVVTDTWSFGVFIITITSIVAHLTILRFVRHFDLMYVFWFVFSIIWIPFNLWDEQSIAASPVHASIGAYMIKRGPFVLNTVLVCAVVMIPLVLARHRRYWIEPHLYCVE